MATMTLLPDGQNNVSTDWIPVGESFVFTALTSDDDLTSYAKCDDINEAMYNFIQKQGKTGRKK